MYIYCASFSNTCIQSQPRIASSPAPFQNVSFAKRWRCFVLLLFRDIVSFIRLTCLVHLPSCDMTHSSGTMAKYTGGQKRAGVRGAIECAGRSTGRGLCRPHQGVQHRHPPFFSRTDGLCGIQHRSCFAPKVAPT